MSATYGDICMHTPIPTRRIHISEKAAHSVLLSVFRCIRNSLAKQATTDVYEATVNNADIRAE